MKTLIVEDDFSSRLMLLQILKIYGECHIAVNGREAIDAFRLAWQERQPYDLICLDIMMPEMDGNAVLMEVRNMKNVGGLSIGKKVKIIMTTSLSKPENSYTASEDAWDAYLVKPIDRSKLIDLIKEFGLVLRGAS